MIGKFIMRHQIEDISAFNWEPVHIFISSTLNDMHAERDYLVKQVFPHLREWCENLYSRYPAINRGTLKCHPRWQ